MHCDKTKCYAGRIIATSKENFINAFLESDTDLETWRINAQNAGLFFKGLGLYDKIQNGAMSLTFSTKRDAVKSGQIFPITKGRLEINKFSINKSPFLTKIVSLTSLTGVLDFLTNSKDLKFDKLESDFTLHDNYVEISDLNIYGPFGPFDLFAKGNINLIDREILLKGYVVPSVYGINTMLKNTPVLGKLFAGKRSGIISAPFKIQQKY